MFKRVLCALLASTLLCMAVSCRRGKDGSDTEGSESDRLPSATQPESTTADGKPGPSPEDTSAVSRHIESLTLDGVPCVSEDISAGLRETDHVLFLPAGASPFALEISGWVGYPIGIDAFGYRIDGGEAVYGLFATDTEEAVRQEGGEHALRFTVTVPLFSLRAGPHTVSFLVRLTDGTVVPLLETLTLSPNDLTVDPTAAYHSSVTHLLGKGPLQSDAYEGRGGSIERGIDIIDAKLDGHTILQDRLLTISGWLAVEGGVQRYVWSPNGVTWFEAVTGGASGEPTEGHFASLGYANATGNAMLRELVLDLSPCHGRNVAVTVGGVPNNAPDTVVPFVTITGLDVPLCPADIDFSFVTQAESNPEGVDFVSSDLKNLFEISYGAGDLRHVTRHGDALCYCYEGIHSLQTVADGQFALTAKVSSMTGASFLFARATRRVISVDEVPIPLNSFYETDGAGLCGGAGIYARLSDGVLLVVIKALDPNAAYRVYNHSFSIAAEGSELTLADDGNTVYVLVDGRELARVTMRGFTEYPEHFREVSPYVRFAATATITMADGQTATIENTLVAAEYTAWCGIAIRGGTIHFSELRMLPFSESGIQAP